MKCINCDVEIGNKKILTKSAIIVDEKIIEYEANLIICPHCKMEYIEGDKDIANAAKNFDDALTKDEKVIGIKKNVCLVCGKPQTNRHHVIPLALKPKFNVTIPLCDEHKDCMHPIVKQYFLPQEIRNNIGTIVKITNALDMSTKALQRKIDFGKNKKLQTKVVVEKS